MIHLSFYADTPYHEPQPCTLNRRLWYPQTCSGHVQIGTHCLLPPIALKYTRALSANQMTTSVRQTSFTLSLCSVSITQGLYTTIALASTMRYEPTRTKPNGLASFMISRSWQVHLFKGHIFCTTELCCRCLLIILCWRLYYLGPLLSPILITKTVLVHVTFFPCILYAL